MNNFHCPRGRSRRPSSIVAIVLIVSLLFTTNAVPARAEIPEVIRKALIAAGIANTPEALNASWQAILNGLRHITSWQNSSSPLHLEAGKSSLETAINKYPKAQEAIAKGIESMKHLATKFKSLNKIFGESSSWNYLKNQRIGNTSLPIVLAIITAVVVGTTSYQLTKAGIKMEKDYQRLLEQQADEEAYANLLGMLVRGLQNGKVKLLPGVSMDDAIRKIQENLETGRAPFLNVLEVRPCPEFSGEWSGEIFVKDVAGSSSVSVGQSRTLSVSIVQDGCRLVMKIGGNEISGEIGPGETIPSTIDGRVERMEVDQAVLRDNATGSIKRAELKLYGLGSGSMKGAIDIEFEQQSGSATITSGGRLTKK